MESLWREVALHLLDVTFAKQLKIFNAAVFLVVHRHGAHFVEIGVKVSQFPLPCLRHRFALCTQGSDLVFQVPNLVDSGFDSFYQFHVHLILVVQEP